MVTIMNYNEMAPFIIYMEMVDLSDEDEDINTFPPLGIFPIKDNDGTKFYVDLVCRLSIT